MSDYEGVETVETVRIAGRVKWFDPGKGYGFIVPDEPSLTDRKDVLLHATADGTRPPRAPPSPATARAAPRAGR